VRNLVCTVRRKPMPSGGAVVKQLQWSFLDNTTPGPHRAGMALTRCSGKKKPSCASAQATQTATRTIRIHNQLILQEPRGGSAGWQTKFHRPAGTISALKSKKLGSDSGCRPWPAVWSVVREILWQLDCRYHPTLGIRGRPGVGQIGPNKSGPRFCRVSSRPPRATYPRARLSVRELRSDLEQRACPRGASNIELPRRAVDRRGVRCRIRKTELA